MKHARLLMASTMGLLAAWTFVAGCVMESRPPEEPATAAPPPAAPAEPEPTATTAPTSDQLPTAPAPAAVAAPTVDTASGTTASSDAGKYDPCAGKKCGDRCLICPPKTPGCFETALVKMCQTDGQCKPATSASCPK